MSLAASAAYPTVALHRILRGNHQQVVEAWVKIQPKLPGSPRRWRGRSVMPTSR